MKVNFLDPELKEWEKLCADEGWPKYKAKQIYRWQGRGIESFDEMSDVSKAMRARLAELYYPGLPKLKEHYSSHTDHSEKFALELEDGQRIESVLMRHNYGNSACISTQAGCKMGCKFCASTGLRFARDLSAGEMLSQILFIQRHSGEEIARLDLMGIGEPLDNYEETVRFIRKCQDDAILGLSPRKVSLSTCGLVPEIYQLAKEGLPVTLTISLHAPEQKLREKIMPIAKKYDLADLISAADFYFSESGRRISYEYALFADVNDSVEDAHSLADLLHGKNCHVNLIPANTVEGTGLLGSKADSVKTFASVLEKRRIQVTVRRSLGQDIQAACGQLRRSSLLAREGR